MEKERSKKELRIQERLTKAFMRVTLIMSIAAVLGIIVIYLISSVYENALKNYGFSQGDIGMAMAAFADTRSALRGAIGYDNQEEINKLLNSYEENKTAFNEHIAEVEKSMVTKEGKAAYQAVMDAVEGYWAVSDSILKEGAVTDRELCVKAQDRAFAELAPRYAEVYSALTNLMDVNIQKGDEIYNLMSVLKLVIVIFMAAIIAVAVVIATKIGRTIAKGIREPLEELGNRLASFSHGDLESPFPEVAQKDEIADIVDDCKLMADTLNVIISDADELLAQMADGNFAVKTSVEEKYEGKFNGLLMSMRNLNRQLDGTLKQISEASEQVSAGSAQLAQSAQDLAEGATEQAGAVQELVATVESVTAISEESAKNATDAANKTRISAEEAHRSREQMNQLTDAMARITETSKQIEDIIVTIEGIAAQTNLLSLNASIEAARAGEAGRGFAVVADQIGKLAGDSADSAVTTKELIGKALEEITRGNHIAELSMQAIEKVLVSMEAFAGMASGAADASLSQADMLKQIEAGIEQISTVVQSNSAASEETSAISEELSAQAMSLENMVEAFELRKD